MKQLSIPEQWAQVFERQAAQCAREADEMRQGKRPAYPGETLAYSIRSTQDLVVFYLDEAAAERGQQEN